MCGDGFCVGGGYDDKGKLSFTIQPLAPPKPVDKPDFTWSKKHKLTGEGLSHIEQITNDYWKYEPEKLKQQKYEQQLYDYEFYKRQEKRHQEALKEKEAWESQIKRQKEAINKDDYPPLDDLWTEQPSAIS